MSEKMKAFLEEVSKNEELRAKLNAADKDELIAMAKQLGIELAEADFTAPVEELSDEELDAVAGGGECVCVLGGGGKSGNLQKTCACVTAGAGLHTDNSARCACTVAGYGSGY